MSICVDVSAEESAELATSVLKIRAEFRRLDQDQNSRLDLMEFMLLRENAAELKRDFSLYDFDRSGTLSQAEFSAVSGLCPAWIRGSIPDPFDELLDKAVSALDESYEQWNTRPQEYVNSHSFVANFIGSISPEGKKFVTGRILRQADPDGDGQMSRADAREFLTYQLGMSWGDGREIREPTGRVLRLDRFLLADLNNDGSVTLDEFTSHGWGTRSKEEFDRLDVEADERITFGEYRDYRHTENYFDTVEWFRNADVDMSGLLDMAEIKEAADEGRRHLVATTIAAFDQDRDQLLSLQELRVSMLGNVNYPWSVRPVDLNRDGTLSYDEFIFHSTDLFQLQRRFYFHRLDRNRDRKLTLDEFEFNEAKPNALRMESKDGQSKVVIFQDEKFPVLGLPDVSPDGTRMLFHRTSSDPEIGSQIVLSDLHGEVITRLCTGTQPSWSGDASQFVCARTVAEGIAGKQIWLMAADGRGGRSIGQGTSPRWSPDGKLIAFMRDNGIVIYDTVTEKSRVLVAREGHRYTSLGDAIAWDVNSKRLALLATRPNFTELVLVSVSRDPVELDQDDQAEDAGQAKQKVADVTLSPQRGFASCRSVGELSWSQDGIYFAIRPNVIRGVAKESTLQLWVPALNGGVKVVPALSRDFAWKSVFVDGSGEWYLAVSQH
jgi:TolB protein